MKKGVSPLIATVLLVMIVVSIGAAVMVVIQNISEQNLATVERQGNILKCAADIQLELYTIETDPRVCLWPPDGTNKGSLMMMVENKGVRDIESWRLIVVGSDNVTDGVNTVNVLPESSIRSFNFTFDESVGSSFSDIESIELRPRLPTGGNSYTTCRLPKFLWQSEELSNMKLCNATTVTWDDNI